MFGTVQGLTWAALAKYQRGFFVFSVKKYKMLNIHNHQRRTQVGKYCSTDSITIEEKVYQQPCQVSWLP